MENIASITHSAKLFGYPDGAIQSADDPKSCSHTATSSSNSCATEVSAHAYLLCTDLGRRCNVILRRLHAGLIEVRLPYVVVIANERRRATQQPMQPMSRFHSFV
jgi:hypothetical protein